ncbi:MAG: hypothetical protein K2Q03_10350 [Sphingobacteriaceae bacterium]|nr:hypothetical protein [Sphingobacteriaceae bacterium]
MKNSAKNFVGISCFFCLNVLSFSAYAQDQTNSVLSLAGSLEAQASIVVVSNKTQYLSGSNDGGVPGLPGVALSQSIAVDIACTNSMLIELLLNSINDFSLRSNSAPQLKVPYQISINNSGFSSFNQTPIAITASIVCHGNTIQIPINITTGSLPYGLSAGSYQDVLQLNLSY